MPFPEHGAQFPSGVRAEAEKGGDTFGVVEAEPEPSEDAEVVGDQPDAPKPERVEQRDAPKPERVEQREHVGENIAHGVPVMRCVRPTSAAQVGRDHSVALGERRG
jgi:hypothetical protein